MQPRPLPFQKGILALSGAGALLSLALEYVHYGAYAAPTATSLCTVAERLDCTSVALSRWSVLLGVPLPVWGFAGFLAVGIAAWQRSRWLLPLASVAALASLVLLGLSAFSLGTLCLLCEGVHLVSFALFALAWRARGAELLPLRHRDSSFLTFAPAAGLLLAVALLLPPYWGTFSWKGDVPFERGQTEEGFPWIGAASPKLTIEEFVDYSCPHCRAASSRNLRKLAEHPDELRIVRRYFPRFPCTEPAPQRCLAFRIAHCAQKQDKFWQTDRWLFEHYDLKRDYDLNEVARAVDLNRDQLELCVETNETYEWAANVWRIAKKLRVPGTPYYLVEKKLVPPAKLAPLIETL